jgi:hypothetical protein
MTDLHTHILPGLDDGARQVEESLELLREQARQGVDTVALTAALLPRSRDAAAFPAAPRGGRRKAGGRRRRPAGDRSGEPCRAASSPPRSPGSRT